MRIIGIILLVIQGFALFGSIVGGNLGNDISFGSIYEIGQTIGFLLPGIIGIILIRKAKRRIV